MCCGAELPLNLQPCERMVTWDWLLGLFVRWLILVVGRRIDYVRIFTGLR